MCIWNGCLWLQTESWLYMPHFQFSTFLLYTKGSDKRLGSLSWKGKCEFKGFLKCLKKNCDGFIRVTRCEKNWTFGCIPQLFNNKELDLFLNWKLIKIEPIKPITIGQKNSSWTQD
jgi:hypothetical protein